MTETILKNDTCPSLSGKSTLNYELGAVDDEISVRIIGNAAGGIFSKEWIPLIQMEATLSAAESPFSSSALHDLFQGKSINTAGFLLAVLLREGLIQPVQGKRKGYTLSSTSKFKNSIESLLSDRKPKKVKP